MKERILELRQAGKSYKQICQQLGCSKGTVAYHCGEFQKQRTKERQQNRRADLVILKKVENFQYDRRLKDKTEDFQRSSKGESRPRKLTFTWKDVIAKFGWETNCYLTGRKLNLREPLSYQFDHIIPRAKGGSNELDNLAICCRDANHAKHDMNLQNFLDLCEQVLSHNGYRVEKMETIRLDEETVLKTAGA